MSNQINLIFLVMLFNVYTSEKVCEENKIKLLFNQYNRARPENKLILQKIEKIFNANCDSFKKNKIYEDLSWESKEFLVSKINSKYSFLDFLILKREELFNRCKVYFKYQIRDLYFHLLRKGFGITEYQLNFISLLNYLKKNKKFENFESAGIKIYDDDYKHYIPFLLNNIEYIPLKNFKKFTIIKTLKVFELINILIKYWNSYTVSPNEKTLVNIIEVLFEILLIKKKNDLLGEELFPDELYQFFLKHPKTHNYIIDYLEKNSDDLFNNSFLNYNYYNQNVKNTVISYLKSSIFVDIRNKYLNAEDSFLKPFDLNDKKIIMKNVSSLIFIYNKHFNFLKKVFNNKEDTKKLQIDHIKELFNKQYNKIQNPKIKNLITEFGNFIFYDTENLITKVYKKENNLHDALVDILIGETEIFEESIIGLMMKNNGRVLTKNINNIKSKINIINDEESKLSLNKNFIKILLVILFNKERKSLLAYDKNLMKKDSNLLKILLDNLSYYNNEVEKSYNIISSLSNSYKKYKFNGIYNKNKEPKINDDHSKYFVYEIIGHSLVKNYIKNYHTIIVDFVKNCNNFTNEEKRKKEIEKIVNENKLSLSKSFSNLLEQNINIFLRRSASSDQLELLTSCPITEEENFDINNEENYNIYNTSNTKKKMSDIIVKTEKIEENLDDFDFRRR